MIPELGHLSLVLALTFAIMLATLPLIGAQKAIPAWIALAKPLAYGQWVFMAISFMCLVLSFLNNDFSVAYVAHNSNLQLPEIYKVSAVWGAHEGSLLLWALTLGTWTGLVALFSRSVPHVMIARVLSVMGLISVGFLLFLLVTSNPFERLEHIPFDGRELNPLLQDFGLAIHPPMLYMGYVGFSVAFSFAIAAMLGGRLDAAWARWSRPWTNVAWAFLTVGIALGSWWAYYELGWGGWWFWDPVENASFMPWLVGTALIHSLAVTEKRGAFKAWTVLLAIFAFSLSLLGTFLVRSGVLTSVHAFASDPERGLFILIFLILVVGSSLTLYSIRAPRIKSNVRFQMVSREAGLLLNNVVLVAVAFAVLMGTLYPLLIDALDAGKISVGPPYFNAVFVPLMSPVLLFMGITALTRWKQDDASNIIKRIRNPFIGSVILGVSFPALVMPSYSVGAAFGMVMAFWVVATSFLWIKERTNGRGIRYAAQSIPRGSWGMITAHLGVAIFVVGVTLVSAYSEEKDIRLDPNESYQLGGYDFIFKGVVSTQGPNYLAQTGRIDIAYEGVILSELIAEKRQYATGMPMTEAGIDEGVFRDLFVALGEPLGDEGAWSLRIYHKPFIRWIWLGCIFMAIGGVLAASDKRYFRMAKKARESSLVNQLANTT